MKASRNYFTPDGHQKFVDELNDLLQNQRPEILKVIQWAAGNGDRSENADYIYGRKRLREMDGRARFLQKRLKDAEIVDYKNFSDENIRFGATVTVQDEEDNEKKYMLVGPDEVDIGKGKISFISPLGRALMGKDVGDIVTVVAPNGEKEIEIIDICYL